MKELNLNNPIFVIYINVEGMSSMRAKQKLSEVVDSFNYENITTWVMPTKGDNRIDCVYDGRSTNPDIKRLILEVNEKIEILSNCQNFEDFKINIRDWRLSKLIK